MDYITEIFERVSVHQLCHFLAFGVDSTEKIPRLSYKERLETTEKTLLALLEENFSTEKNYSEIDKALNQCLCATQDVYMEIGIQCGFSLATQLLSGAQ